jgi:hypothetical protein
MMAARDVACRYGLAGFDFADTYTRSVLSLSESVMQAAFFSSPHKKTVNRSGPKGSKSSLFDDLDDHGTSESGPRRLLPLHNLFLDVLNCQKELAHRFFGAPLKEPQHPTRSVYEREVIAEKVAVGDRYLLLLARDLLLIEMTEFHSSRPTFVYNTNHTSLLVDLTASNGFPLNLPNMLERTFDAIRLLNKDAERKEDVEVAAVLTFLPQASSRWDSLLPQTSWGLSSEDDDPDTGYPHKCSVMGDDFRLIEDKIRFGFGPRPEAEKGVTKPMPDFDIDKLRPDHPTRHPEGQRILSRLPGLPHLAGPKPLINLPTL